MATTTQKLIVEYMANHYGIGWTGIHDGGATTATIADKSVFSGQKDTEGIEVGSEAIVTQDAGGSSAAPEGEVTTLTSRPSVAAGVMNILPVLTSAAADTDTFLVLRRPFTFDSGPHAVRQAVDKVLLERLPEKLLVPLTMVTDGDMLAAAVANWTDANCTSAKSAASFPLAQRELQVTNSAANGYTSPVSIPVDSDISYYLEVTVRVTSAVATATARLDCYDDTGSTALDVINDNTTQQEPYILANTVQMGSATELVSIRLGADENSVVSLWSNLIFYKSGMREFVVQDRAELDRLGNIYVASGTTWRTRQLTPIGHDLEQRTAGLWVYKLHSPISGRAVFYEEFRKPAALGTTLTATAYAPVEEVAAVAAERLLRPLRAEDRWASLWSAAAQDAGPFIAKRRQQRSLVNRAPRTVALPPV